MFSFLTALFRKPAPQVAVDDEQIQRVAMEMLEHREAIRSVRKRRKQGKKAYRRHQRKLRRR